MSIPQKVSQHTQFWTNWKKSNFFILILYMGTVCVNIWTEFVWIRVETVRIHIKSVIQIELFEKWEFLECPHNYRRPIYRVPEVTKTSGHEAMFNVYITSEKIVATHSHTRTHTHTRIYISIWKRGADKFLARPGRKQATATKLGIYSRYSPQSSINLIVRCYNFSKPLKKIQNAIRPTS